MKNFVKTLIEQIKFWFRMPKLLKKLQEENQKLHIQVNQEHHRMSLQLSAHRKSLDNIGSLLTGAVDVHYKYQPSIAMIYWYDPKAGGMNCKAFEIDQESGLKGVLEFLHTYRLPSEKVFFDVPRGQERHTREQYNRFSQGRF